MNLRKQFILYLCDIIRSLTKEHSVLDFDVSKVSLDYTPNLSFGHYACNGAMVLSKILNKNPLELAGDLKKRIENSEIAVYLKKIQLAGPGFINFFLNENGFRFFFERNFSVNEWIKSSFTEDSGSPKYHFEYVSANPTGPLNIVSARAAAVGDSICRILRRTGKKVYREYYVNDFGNQIFLLGISLGVRYLQSKGLQIEMPENGYQGNYLINILQKIETTQKLPEFFQETGNLELSKKQELDKWLDKAAEYFSTLAVAILLETHKKDLENFRVHFDEFFSESRLHENEHISVVFELLSKKGYIYEKEKAFYFKSASLGDDKDRVLKKSDGQPTYFLSDIAYHYNKFKRGFHKVYDFWGPDHHGYITRLEGAMKALGCLENDTEFKILIIQQVNLIENKKPIVMSKRLGKFHTMADLLEKIPVDVSRYFFVSRSLSQHLDFDLDIALDQSSKNPVYYIQYAHARIHSIFREALPLLEGVMDINTAHDKKNSSILLLPASYFSDTEFENWMFTSERDVLLFQLLKFVDEIDAISQNLEIQRLATYLYELASKFTGFYHADKNRILSLLKQRESQKEGIFLLRICQITAAILKEGLTLLGISSPHVM